MSVQADNFGDYVDMASKLLDRTVPIRRHSFGVTVEGVPYTDAEVIVLAQAPRDQVARLHARRLTELIFDGESIADEFARENNLPPPRSAAARRAFDAAARRRGRRSGR